MKTVSHELFRIFDFLIWVLFFTLVFFILTNGVPLIEWGWMSPLKSKMRYLVMNRILAPTFLAALLATYWISRENFQKLSLVKISCLLIKKYYVHILWLLFLFYGSIAFYGNMMRHNALETRAFDLGIFAQAVWNTTQGAFLFSSIKENICLLGDHMSPVLALLAPLYKLWPSPLSILLTQSFAMAACLFGVSKIAQHKLKDNFQAICFVLVFFILSAPRNTLREDFHPEVLAEPILLLAFYFLERRKLIGWLACTLFAVSTKENMWGISLIMSGYAFINNRFRITSIVIGFLSIACFLLTTHYLIPTISQKPYLYHGFYLHLIKNPVNALTLISSPETWSYLVKIYSPVAFLSFFSPLTFLLNLPVLFQNIASNNPVFRSLSYHYTVGLIPFVIISAIYGFSNICNKLKLSSLAGRWGALACLTLTVILSAHSDYYFIWKSRLNRSSHKDMIREQLAKIPANLTVLTHNSLVPHVINRKFVYQFENNQSPTKSESARQRNADVVIFDALFWEPATQPLNQVIQDLQSTGYHKAFQQNQFYIFKRE